jgi:hypothetical protein
MSAMYVHGKVIPQTKEGSEGEGGGRGQVRVGDNTKAE